VRLGRDTVADVASVVLLQDALQRWEQSTGTLSAWTWFHLLLFFRIVGFTVFLKLFFDFLTPLFERLDNFLKGLL